MDIQFIAQADAATLQLEKAKRRLESAKADLELAKKAYDEMLAQADDMGIPKAKLKKLTEDRIQSLFESGLLNFSEDTRLPAKESKPRKVKAKSATSSGSSETEGEGPASEAAADSDQNSVGSVER